MRPAEPATKTVPLGMPGTRTVAGTDNRSGGKSRSPINSSTAYYSAIKHMVFVYPKPSSAISKLFLNRFERGLGYIYLQNSTKLSVRRGHFLFPVIVNTNKNSSVDEIANVNFYAVRPEDTRIR